MSGTSSGNTPTLVGWLAAFLVGLLAFALVRYQFAFVMPSAIAVGAAATLAVILLLSTPGEGPETQETRVRKIVPQPERAAPDEPRPVMPTRVAKAERSVETAVPPSAPPSEPAEPAPRQEAASDQASGAGVSEVVAGKAGADSKPRAAKSGAEAKPKSETSVATAKPGALVRLDGPRGGKADDLKELEGVGPALEKLLNGLGFYHFDQIAAWSDDDVAAVDAEMKGFKGRITRDRWVAQARIIVTEGLEAFRERAKSNSY